MLLWLLCTPRSEPRRRSVLLLLLRLRLLPHLLSLLLLLLPPLPRRSPSLLRLRVRAGAKHCGEPHECTRPWWPKVVWPVALLVVVLLVAAGRRAIIALACRRHRPARRRPSFRPSPELLPLDSSHWPRPAAGQRVHPRILEYEGSAPSPAAVEATK